METQSSNHQGQSWSASEDGFNGRIAVLMGGNAAEREVSLESGNAVLNSLQASGFDVIAIDTASDVVDALQTIRPEFAFIALHGKGGEDGRMQALLESLAIPYSGSGVLGSALAMDKVRSKNVWRGLGLPTPAFELLTRNSDFAAVLARLNNAVFVKPVDEGSSIGMSLATTEVELRQAYAKAAEFGVDIFAEQFVAGPEYTVSILQNHCLPSIRIQTQRDFYDYAAKYQDDDTQFFIPSGLDDSEEQALQHLAREAFDALACKDWGRVDFMRDQNSGQFYLLEANTVPGLTTHSLVPMAAKAAGMSFDELMLNIIELAMTAVKAKTLLGQQC